MKFKYILIMLSLVSTNVFARGGDDAGNGGFAYKQSIKILEMATSNLEHKIIDSDLKELHDHPVWRAVLQETLNYDHLQQLPKKNAYRGGRKLAMDYVVNPPAVKILKPYYEAFMGKTDDELEKASLEVEKRLLHEASHIWGYNEKDSEAFALRFLNDVKENETRPTNQIDIKSFCSCLNGKSDIISDCDDYCRQMPATSSPILFLNTIMGPDVSSNPKLGNLYNWCNVQLAGDTTSPQCFLNATDGVNTIKNIPVLIDYGSNSLTANIQQLAKDRTYILKIVEGKSGSNAQSKEFQLRRVTPRPPSDPYGALKIAPINQYTCLIYGGEMDSNGNMRRTNYARNYFYFAGNETPPPMPPVGQGNQSPIVCHDEVFHPGNDSAIYPRLELIPQLTAMWDKADSHFVNNDGTGLAINKTIATRLYNEYGVTATVDILKLINYPNRPSTTYTSTINIPLGYMMLPFTDQKTGNAFCPTHSDYNGNEPLFNILGDYMDDTEGLYVAEKEAETIQDNNTYRTIYGTMFVTESLIKKYGFYIENGLKVRADQNAMNAKTIYYYWPVDSSIDPLEQGNRKLFTVRTPDTLNGNVPIGIPSSIRTTDKRIGCVPRTVN